jgi:hypothetical protein
MPSINASFSRDNNRVPVTVDGFIVTSDKTFTANGTVVVPIFSITGAVRVMCLYGIVTTAIGSNHTGAYWRLNDQTVTANITLDTTGATLSSFPVGSIVKKWDLVTAIAKAGSSATGTVVEPIYPGSTVFCEFDVVKKATADTNIEYVYTTNNTSKGAIRFYCGFYPLSDDGIITAI